jgi:hypothetical protein
VAGPDPRQALGVRRPVEHGQLALEHAEALVLVGTSRRILDAHLEWLDEVERAP